MTSAESRLGAQVTAGMVSALARDAGLRRVFWENFLAPRMAGFRTVFERAAARGEMPEGHDLDLLARLFPALVLLQLVMPGELPDAWFAGQIMDEVVYPLATSPVAPAGPAPDTAAGVKTEG
ncbi:MAG: TetR-like C-terminal domain-containing protein [Trebonia sp.]